MNQSWDIAILILVIFGLIFFAVAVFALYWAAKNKQFESFDQGARTIFDDEEPEGLVLDHFPVKQTRKPRCDT